MTPRAAQGYSYLELMFVAALLSVLTALVLPTLHNMNRLAREKELSRGLAKIRSAIDRYHRDWSRGCIESDDDAGWPKDLKEMNEGLDWSDRPECQPRQGASPTSPTTTPGERPRRRLGPAKEPAKKIYLARVPRDPFNREGEEWDTMGWKARSYDDDIDSTTWGDKGVYDVYSASELTALDGTTYATW